jgi:hypothetical protein
VIHEHHFTPEEADAFLPGLEALLRKLREARDSLTDEEAHRALGEASAGNGGGAEGRLVGEAFLVVRSLLGELQNRGLVVRDIDRGLVDFPAIIDGEEAYLCWQAGEERVAFWHDLDSGFAGRQPLEGA